jgi:transcriptional regulator with XRE-family HTH domain
MPDVSFNNHGKRNLDTNIELNPVDVHVGSRVRLRRISAGISEEELRAALGVTAEQLRAYESGATRIGASLLYDVSKLLECLPKVFFEDMKSIF